jgi:hypothetical protein
VSDIEADESPATVWDTQQYLLHRSKRTIVHVRKTFVQAHRSQAAEDGGRAGPLARFVRGRDLRGLRAYLLILAVTSGEHSAEGWSTSLRIRAWARAFGTTRDATRSAAATAVSKTMRRLEDRHLIERSRSGRERRIRVTLLREDGSTEPYTGPKGNTVQDRFLRLDHAFWAEGWWEKLSLPATAMLLVALGEKPGFRLPTEHVPLWYGTFPSGMAGRPTPLNAAWPSWPPSTSWPGWLGPARNR